MGNINFNLFSDLFRGSISNGFGSSGFANSEFQKNTTNFFWVLSGELPSYNVRGRWTSDGVWMGTNTWLG